MSKIDDGGAAFPKSDCIEPDMEPIRYSDGMTLRDYFAAAALQGWLASYDSSSVHPVNNDTERDVARQAYTMADAMLAARKEGA